MMDSFKILCTKVVPELKGWGVWFGIVDGEGVIYRHYDAEPNFKPGNTYGCVID